MQRFATLLTSLVLVLAAACGGSSNPGVIFDPTPPGSGQGGGGGGGTTKGPSAAAVAGGLSITGNPSATVFPNGNTVSVHSPICIIFNESVQAVTLTNTTLVVRVQQGQTIPTTMTSYGGSRFFVLAPNTLLPANKTIEIVASNLIRDLDGNGLTIPTGGVIGHFTTEPTAESVKAPSVVASFPVDGTKNVSPGTSNFGSGAGVFPGIPTQIITVFSRPIAPSTILGDLTPPPGPEKIGLTLISQFDPDGSGPQPQQTKSLIPGTGAVLLPFTENRVWVATPTAPFDPGANVTLGVGPGVKSDDIQPAGLNPPFAASFTVAPIEAPQFANIDITPATAAELSTTPALLNKVVTLPDNSANPTYSGNFTIGVIFGATSLATDTVEIQLHDAVGAGNVLFTKKARAGAGQSNFGTLSILDSKGVSKLGQGVAVIAARTKRGSVTSPWSIGPPILIDTIAPEIKAIGPPAEGATLLASGRTSSIYGSTSEQVNALAITQIESPVGTVSFPPIPAGAQGHLLSTNNTFFMSLPIIPAPPIATPAGVGTPPVEPRAKAKLLVSDSVGNQSAQQDAQVVFRGRMGGPTIASQQALTVVVYDEDTLATVANAVVLVDAATPSGTSTNQVSKSVTLSTTTGTTEATFVAPTDFTNGTSTLTVTASAPNYDITTVVGVTASFVSIPIRKTRGNTVVEGSFSPSIVGAPSGSTVDFLVSARPDLGDRLTATTNQSLGGTPVLAATTIAALRPLYIAAFVRNATSSTYLNDATNYPVSPIALGGVSSITTNFGQSFGQTTDTSDDPISVPPGGSLNVTIPGGSFDSASATVESGLFVPGSRLGVSGQIGIGEGRNSSIVAGVTAVSVSFDPKLNNQFLTVDPAQNPPFGTVIASPVDPNSSPTDARVEVRVEDIGGRVSRSMARSTTSGGPISSMTLPEIPDTLAPASASTISKDSPKIAWLDVAPTADGFYIIHLRMKQTTPIREWRVYVRRPNTDTSVVGNAKLQLPSLVAFGSTVGTPIPISGSLLDQFVDAITQEGIDFNDFFFEDLRAAQPDPGFENPVTFSRGAKAEIIY